MSDPLRCLAFVETVEQLRSLRAGCNLDAAGVLVVGLAPNLSLAHRLSREGIQVGQYTDFLSAGHYLESALEALQNSRTWLPIDGAMAEGIPVRDLLESIRLELLPHFEEAALAHRVSAGALDRLHPAEVLLPAGLDDRFSAVLRFEADRRGVPVRCVAFSGAAPPEEPSSHERAPTTPVIPAQAGIHSPVTAGAEWRLRSFVKRAQGLARLAATAARCLVRFGQNQIVLAAHRLRQALDPRPVLLSFGGDVDFVHQRQVMPAVAHAGAVRPVMVCKGGVDRTSFNRPGRSSYPYLRHLPLNNLLRWRRFLPFCRRRLEALRALRTGYDGPYPYLFANPWLDPLFERLLLHLLPHAMAAHHDAAALLRQIRPRLVLTSNDVSFEVRALVLAARARGVPTLGIIHSGLNNMHYRDFRSDRLAVWGTVHVEDAIRILGKQPSQMVAIGNPQYDTLADPTRHSRESGNPLSHHFRSRGSPSVQRESPVATTPPEPETADLRPPRVLVITALTRTRFAFLDLTRHWETWKELERLPGHGVQLVVKPHPRFDDYGFFQELRPQIADWRETRPGIAVARREYLEEVLPGCDLVIVPNTPTTGAVEAMLAGKPVLLVTYGYADLPFVTSLAPGCLVVPDLEQLVPTVLRLLSDPDLRAKVVQQGQAFLDRFLGPRDGGATERLAALIAAQAGAAR